MNKSTDGGPFCIDQIECVACGACESVAPDLIGHETDPASSGTYFFKRQPETQGEIDRAIQAVNGCCVDCIHYRGDDPAVRDRIAHGSATSTCLSHPGRDTLFERNQPFRTHRNVILSRTLTLTGLALVVVPFCLAVFASHMTASYARNLYLAFLLGILLFSAGRKRS